MALIGSFEASSGGSSFTSSSRAFQLTFVTLNWRWYPLQIIGNVGRQEESARRGRRQAKRLFNYTTTFSEFLLLNQTRISCHRRLKSLSKVSLSSDVVEAQASIWIQWRGLFRQQQQHRKPSPRIFFCHLITEADNWIISLNQLKCCVIGWLSCEWVELFDASIDSRGEEFRHRPAFAVAQASSASLLMCIWISFREKVKVWSCVNGPTIAWLTFAMLLDSAACSTAVFSRIEQGISSTWLPYQTDVYVLIGKVLCEPWDVPRESRFESESFPFTFPI